MEAIDILDTFTNIIEIIHCLWARYKASEIVKEERTTTLSASSKTSTLIARTYTVFFEG